MKLIRMKRKQIQFDPKQPRRHFDPQGIEELAAAKRNLGDIDPILVRWDEPLKCYVVIDGHRRLMADDLNGVEEVDCLVDESDADDFTILARQVASNEGREYMRPMELADALERLQDLKGCTGKALAGWLGLSERKVSYCASFKLLPAHMQQALDEGKLTEKAANALARCPEDAARRELFLSIQDGRINSDQAVAAVQQSLGGARPRNRDGNKPVVVKGQGGVAVRVDPGQSIDELHSVLGRLFRAAEAAKRTGNIQDFLGKFAK